MNVDLLNSEETVARLHSLIKGARTELFLVSPYIKLHENDRVWQSVRIAANNKVRVTMVTRCNDQADVEDVDEKTLSLLKRNEDKNVHLLHVPWLHAKVYWSESAVLITSLNLLATSIAKSVEVGVYSERAEDIATAKKYLDKEILPLAVSVLATARSGGRPPERAGDGHCIRCGDEIPLNAKRPYCSVDYDNWAEYENADYPDKFCHGCGNKHRATMRRPLCSECHEAIG